MSRSSVGSWLESLEPSHRVKRRRRNTDGAHNTTDHDFLYAYNVPNPPLAIESNIDMPRPARGRKRPGDALANDENDIPSPLVNDTPRTAADRTRQLISVPLQASSSKDSREPSPPKRPRSTSPVKTQIDLQKLEKPVHISDLDEDNATSVLPADIQPLYTRFQSASQQPASTVPVEVHAKVLSYAPSAELAAPDASKIAAAEADLSRIRHIRQQALMSAKQRRHECAWNNLIHTPLLLLAFDEPEPEKFEQSAVSVRLEPVMSVSIARDSVPRVQQRFAGGDVDSQSVLACSASNKSIDTNQASDLNSTQTQTNSDHRKVDYVVVLDIAKNAPLKQTIINLILSQRSPAHVNQTLYPSVSDSPIGLSIETKTVSARDPLVQLGIWIAAWHKRMNDLRMSRLRQHALLGEALALADSAPGDPRLVSVPLIVVTGHEWDVYFACDEGSTISIRGPLRIGSTSTVLQVYVLLTSLRAVKEWMKTTYYKCIVNWFMCKE
ncbi:hypothetical protein RRF57_013341 [Xylaria bambusicola]|uniref:PD-(D/E)XK nuclease-like domain-containing protein n=1 Tax=Xylaria bambusicola TaxID=326684 RepID=A0AAN7ZE96_9PEZI